MILHTKWGLHRSDNLLPLLHDLDQWLLNWVQSSPRGSVTQLKEFGELVRPNRTIRMVFLFMCEIHVLLALNTVIFCQNDA